MQRYFFVAPFIATTDRRPATRECRDCHRSISGASSVVLARYPSVWTLFWLAKKMYCRSSGPSMYRLPAVRCGVYESVSHRWEQPVETVYRVVLLVTAVMSAFPPCTHRYHRRTTTAPSWYHYCMYLIPRTWYSIVDIMATLLLPFFQGSCLASTNGDLALEQRETSWFVTARNAIVCSILRSLLTVSPWHAFWRCFLHSSALIPDSAS